jgi:hypothetical protein
MRGELPVKQRLLYVLLALSGSANICLAQTGQVSIDRSLAGKAHPSPYNLYGAQFPRIESDNRVTFRFNAPAAQKVQVAIANVPFDLVKGEDGFWTYTSEPQDAGYHNYWMIVDGAVVVDPATNAFIGYSHMCNGFEIPDPDGGFYELEDVPHGDVVVRNYFSKTTGSWRHVFIFTPPGYEKNASRYPIVPAAWRRRR